MNLDPQKTVYLIDGSSFLYRAYYSLKPLHTPNGISVHAVYGFCRMIKKLIDTFKAHYFAVVWDSKGKTIRHELYTEYKATRQAPPSDIFEQKELILEFIDLVGIKQFAQTGIEADDLIFSIALEQKKAGMDCVIVTLDKDMRQMLAPGIVIFDPLKEIYIDAQKSQELNGVPVSKLPFYFSLIGDSSDNIPGVKGIGPKTALELIQQFDSLDDLYTNCNTIARARTKSLLLEHKKEAYLSLDLFTLRYYPCNTQTKELSFDSHHWKNAYPLFEELNFKSLLKDVSKSSSQNNTTSDKKAYWKKQNFELITTVAALKSLCADIKTSGLFACDTETDSLQPQTAQLIGISIALPTGRTAYIPCGHTTNESQLLFSEIMQELKPIFADSHIHKIMHNAKYDMLVLSSSGMPVNGLIFDTLIAARIGLKAWQKINLKSLSESFFNEEMLTFEDVVKNDKLKNFAQVDLETALLYAGADAHQTLKLYEPLHKLLKEEEMVDLYNTIEHQLIRILFEMEKEGIILDESIIKIIDTEVTAKITDIEHSICEMVGMLPGTINLNSPKQIEQLLFENLKLPPQKKSAKGTALSTDAEVLHALAPLHPVVGLLMSFRELTKLKNTYIDALPTYINSKTGKIHTTFSQTGVATGRLSSSDPNLQNIPVTGFGLEIRSAFKPKEGHLFISADYSQIELRVLAQLANEKNLINAFNEGHDIHQETASRLFDIPLTEVTQNQRQLGKRINFSILYGLTPYGLSKDLGISFSDAKKYIEKYFAQYPSVSEWMESTVEFAKRKGYVETFWKRRRYIPNIYEKNKHLYEEARRVAINTVAQGTAADIMKLGMIALDKKLKEENLDAQILLQIHDELLISANKNYIESVSNCVTTALESVVHWKIPLLVTVRSGSTWKEVSK